MARFSNDSGFVEPVAGDPLRDAWRPQSLGEGAVLGAIGAAAYGAFEDGMRAWSGLGYGPTLDETFGVTVAVGAVAGAVIGAGGIRGARFGLFFSALWSGAVLSGPVCQYVASEGGFALWPLPVTLLVVGALAFFPATRGPIRPLLGLSVGLLALTAIVGSAVPHLVAGADAPALLPLGAVAACAGFALGALTAVLAGSAGPLHLGTAWLVLGLIGGALAALRGGPRPLPVATGDAQPPIVIVAVDGLRADALTVLGGERKAPNLDHLAFRGALFSNTTATAPWSLPSAASAFTGRYPHTHGADHARSGLRGDVPTVFEALSAGGTKCAGFVSGRDWGAGTGLDRGFAVWDDGTPPVRGLLEPLAASGLLPSVHERDAAGTTDAALAWIGAQTHSQWCALVRYGEPAGTLPTDDPRTAWLRQVTVVDTALGRLMDGLPKGTRVVLFGTHGVELATTRQDVARTPAGTKWGHSLYEEVVHVPLIVVGLGRGGRVDGTASLVDVAPTLARLGNVPFTGSDGLVLAEKIPADRTVFAEGMRWGKEHKLARSGRYKYVADATGGGLWDLNADPHEIAQRTGLSGDERSVELTLQSALPHFSPETTSVPWDAVLHDLAQRMARRPPP